MISNKIKKKVSKKKSTKSMSFKRNNSLQPMFLRNGKIYKLFNI